MKVCEEHMQTKGGNKKRLRLERIGQTRWSSRGRALRKLFGSYTDQSSEFSSDLLILLQPVSEATDYKGSVRYEAQKLSENLRKFGLGWVCWVLWHINPCRLFNAKSIFM